MGAPGYCREWAYGRRAPLPTICQPWQDPQLARPARYSRHRAVRGA